MDGAGRAPAKPTGVVPVDRLRGTCAVIGENEHYAEDVEDTKPAEPQKP